MYITGLLRVGAVKEGRPPDWLHVCTEQSQARSVSLSDMLAKLHGAWSYCLLSYNNGTRTVSMPALYSLSGFAWLDMLLVMASRMNRCVMCRSGMMHEVLVQREGSICLCIIGHTMDSCWTLAELSFWQRGVLRSHNEDGNQRKVSGKEICNKLRMPGLPTTHDLRCWPPRDVLGGTFEYCKFCSCRVGMNCMNCRRLRALYDSVLSLLFPWHPTPCKPMHLLACAVAHRIEFRRHRPL